MPQPLRNSTNYILDISDMYDTILSKETKKMYLQITTKCNMRCAHCLFSCAPNKGQHMSLTTFHKALKFSKSYDEYISVGGGEPTLHPHFEQIMYECISATSTDTPLWIVTNGTHKRR